MAKIVPLAVTSIAGLVSLPVVAADLQVKVEVPRLNVAEYHKPYVAIWLEKNDQSFAGNLAVWYDLKKRDNEGAKWLKDLRQWWRRSGRELSTPVDGLTSATRNVGEHSLVFSGEKSVLSKLPAGEYQLVVEAAREGGGREVVKVPFQWPVKAEAKASGSHELGVVSISAK